MAKRIKIEARTISFIRSLQLLKERHKMPSNKDLAVIMGITSLSTISEIKAERQNIQPDSWFKFMQAYKSEFPEFIRELEKQKMIKDFDRSGYHTFQEVLLDKKYNEQQDQEKEKGATEFKEDDASYSKTIPRLLTMLEKAQDAYMKEQNNVSNAHEIIRILAEKVPDVPDISERTKNGSPSSKTLKSVKPK